MMPLNASLETQSAAATTRNEPLVSVITPVYNGAEFLSQCIDSILHQSYSNWNCTIVNNCSTDGTLDIAKRYAAQDARIRIVNNDRLLPIIQNHNRAIREISADSKYCKMVFADDWLFPDCLSRMVKIAEAHPSVGLVGAYGLDGVRVLWTGLPYPGEFISGREICRKTLLGGPYIFGTPTSLLIRSDLIRSRHSFYNEANLHADAEVCFEILRDSDFGFAHQVLTYSRVRSESNSATADLLESIILGNLSFVVSHGLAYLTPGEYELRVEQWLRQYYQMLAKSLLRGRDAQFWQYHRERLHMLKQPLDRARLARAVLRESLESFTRPLGVLDGVRQWWLSGSDRRPSNARPVDKPA